MDRAAITPEPVPPPEVPPLPTPQEYPPVRDPPQPAPPVHDPPSQPPVPVHAPTDATGPATGTPIALSAPSQIPPSPTPMNPSTMNPPLPPLPYGAAEHLSPLAPRTLSEAIDAVHEHCRQIEWRRMAIALRQREEEQPPQPPRPH